MNEKKLTTHLTAIARRDVPESLDLWSAIRGRIERGQPTPYRKQQGQIARWARAAALLALILLVGTATTIALSPLERSIASEAGIDAIYRAALTHEVDQRQTVGDLAVTLQWAYADINRVILAYSVQGEVPQGYRAMAHVESLMDGSGAELELGSSRSVILPGERDTAWVSDAMTPSSLHGGDSLDLRVVLRVAGTETPPIGPFDSFTPGIVSEGYATFELRIPVTGGHVIEVGQRVEADGVPVTLERVVIAPSMTLAEVCYEVPDADAYRGWSAFGTLSAGWRTQIEGDMAGTSVVGNRYCGTMFFRDQVPLEQAQYTLTIRAIEGNRRDGAAESWRINGPWRFEIDVTR